MQNQRWYIRAGKLVRKTGSLRLTPESDSGNIPPFLPQSDGIEKQPIGHQIFPDTGVYVSRVALVATICGSIIASTFGGSGQIVQPPPGELTISQPAPIVPPQLIEYRNTIPMLSSAVTAVLRAPLFTKVQRSVTAQTDIPPNLLTRDVAVVQAPPGAEAISQPTSVGSSQFASYQNTIPLLSSGVAQAPPGKFEAARQTPALGAQIQQMQPANMPMLFSELKPPLTVFSGLGEAPSRASIASTQGSIFFPGFFGAVQAAPPGAEAISQPVSVGSSQFAIQQNTIPLLSSGVVTPPPGAVLWASSVQLPQPQRGQQQTFFPGFGDLPPGTMVWAQRNAAPVIQIQAQGLSPAYGQSEVIPQGHVEVSNPRLVRTAIQADPADFFPGFGQSLERPQGRAEVSGPRPAPAAQQTPPQGFAPAFSSMPVGVDLLGQPNSSLRALQLQQQGFFPGFGTVEQMPPGVDLWGGPLVASAAQQARFEQRFLGNQEVEQFPTGQQFLGQPASTPSRSLLLAFAPVFNPALFTPCVCGLSAQHLAWIEGLARAHGLIDPLAVTSTSGVDGSLSDGTLTQTLVAGVLTTVSGPSGAAGPSALTGTHAALLEALARVYGLIDPLTVTSINRSDGTLSQDISVAGSTATYTRLP